jgi:hypothetical protein
MDRAGRIEMRGGRLGRDGGTAVGDLDNVIAERFGHAVHRQRASDETLHEFQAAHRPLLVAAHDAIAFAARPPCHSTLLTDVSASVPAALLERIEGVIAAQRDAQRC